MLYLVDFGLGNEFMNLRNCVLSLKIVIHNKTRAIAPQLLGLPAVFWGFFLHGDFCESCESKDTSVISNRLFSIICLKRCFVRHTFLLSVLKFVTSRSFCT